MRWVVFAALAACGDNGAAARSEIVKLATISGQDAQEWAGYSLGTAGDVNGDGKVDFVTVGLSAANGGRVSLFYAPLLGAVTTTQADVIVTGERGFENLGESVVEAGGCDLDNDGYAELILGAPFADRDRIGSISTSGDNAGRVYVFYGGPSLTRRLSAASADETFVGEAAYDVAGKAVACLGDLDGDGHDDFAIGAPRGGPYHEGRVYVVYGAPRHGYGLAPRGLEHADAFFTAPAAHELAGATVLRGGDLDGDGREDLVIGAPSARSRAGERDGGAAYVVPGISGRFPRSNILGAHVIRGAAGQRLGHALARAGDFDGDELDDLLVGSSPVLGAARVPGEAYVVRGRHDLPTDIDATSAIALRGETAGDVAGVAVTALGDLDRDGRSDIAIGAVRGDGDEPKAGRVYFVKGRAAVTAIDLGAETVVLGGRRARDYLGETLRASDVDGDGYLDLMISARGAPRDTTASAGEVYVISGKELGGK